MKRPKTASEVNIQLQLENNILTNNNMNKVFESRRNEIFNLRDFMSLIKSNITLDELSYFRREFEVEINQRTSLICEMVPGINNDVWTTVFRMVAHGAEIIAIMPLLQVSKRWAKCLSRTFTEVCINEKMSMSVIPHLHSLRSLSFYFPAKITKKMVQNSFTSLESLTIKCNSLGRSLEIPTDVPDRDDWSKLTNLKTLEVSNIYPKFGFNYIIDGENIKLLTNLHTLRIGKSASFINSSIFEHLVKLKNLFIYDRGEILNSPSSQRRRFNSIYGENFQNISCLKDLEIIRMPIHCFLNIREIQDKYPHIKFQFLIESEIILHDFIGYYEGDLEQKDNDYIVREGKGASYYDNGDRYVGEFKNNKMNGFGKFYYRNGDWYEGQFKHDYKEGKGIFHYKNGERFEGEFKNDMKVS